MEEDREILRRFGVRALDSQVEEVMKLITTNPAYKEDLEKFRMQVKAPATEDDFLAVPTLANSGDSNCTQREDGLARWQGAVPRRDLSDPRHRSIIDQIQD